MTRNVLFGGVSLLLFCSCQPQHAAPQKETGSSSVVLTEERVIEIAKQAVDKNDTWADRATYDAKKQSDGTWFVTVWRIEGYDNSGKPQFVTGGHRFVSIDSTGRVVDYVRGR